MDVEKSSLCNCVVNFLLEEKYLLTAFELLHELLEDGRHDQAIRLREFFADPNLFPADQIAKYNSLRVADPQSLLQEKETIEEKLAISEYELRLAREDLSRLKTELQKQKESSINGDDGPHQNINASEDSENQQDKRNSQLSSLGSLKDAERKDINCAIKEYLLFAGYRLTAMTFIEEVTDQNLDVWAKSPACVSDALRRYYYQYLSATNEAAEEKLSILRENESLAKENERLNQENETLLKSKESVDNQIIVLTKSLESAQKDLKDREITIQGLRKSLDAQRKELNECRAEITSLKMHIEGTRASRQSPQVGNNLNEVKYIHNDAEIANGMDSAAQSSETKISLSEDMLPMEKVVKMNEEKTDRDSIDPTSTSTSNATELPTVLHDENVNVEQKTGARDRLSNPHLEDVCLSHKSESPKRDTAIEKMALETIQTLSDALPKIVPYVLINHREELLPLIMCAIERHPDSSVRDSLTHTLFNLIKKPDEQQRRIIMDACVTLAKNVGEMRTETELLPQCWEQINHTYEERRLLVAQSCGELAEFVRPEIRDSLILSIVQQLIEDPATVVREAAAHNVALLLPLFPNRDKYFKVEELMFQLVCDPSGLVVETTLKELVPAVITWGGKLDHILRILMSHILSSAQRCPPLSGVEGSVESHFRVLGERERWNVDVLLRMLMELLPFIHQKCIETCPFTSAIESLTSPEQANSFFSTALLQLYAGGHMDWPAFDWMYVDCFPDLIQFSCLLPQKEDTLRTRIAKFLLDVHKRFGDDYLEHVMLPVFLVAVGDCDSADLKFFPPSIHSRVKGLRPKTAVAEKLAIMCVLPLLLSGVLGACASDEHLSRYLRKLLVQNAISEDSWSGYRVAEVIDAIRFVCTFEEHHGVVFNILWEMVVSSNTDMKTEAANLLKVLVPYIDVKVASTQVLPALVTLGSDQNLNVKYASIDAFGAVAQHFKNDMIVDKIHIQMDGFLEDGSHEATIAVIRALVGAVPHTTERLREYLLSKISSLTALPAQGTDITRRREKADVFCEAVRALDATDLPSTSTRDLLITSIQNLLKDPDSLDPAHKEALEIILKERSGGAFESISKAMGMGAHLGIATSVTSFFGEGRGKKNSGDQQQFEAINSPPPPSPLAQQDGTRFQRMMRGGFTDILRGKGKGADDSST